MEVGAIPRGDPLEQGRTRQRRVPQEQPRVHHRAGLELEEPRTSTGEEHRGEPKVAGQLVDDLGRRAGGRAESVGHGPERRAHRAADHVARRPALDQFPGPVEDGAGLDREVRERVTLPWQVTELARVPPSRQCRCRHGDHELGGDDHRERDAEAGRQRHVHDACDEVPGDLVTDGQPVEAGRDDADLGHEHREQRDERCEPQEPAQPAVAESRREEPRRRGRVLQALLADHPLRRRRTLGDERGARGLDDDAARARRRLEREHERVDDDQAMVREALTIQCLGELGVAPAGQHVGGTSLLTPECRDRVTQPVVGPERSLDESADVSGRARIDEVARDDEDTGTLPGTQLGRERRARRRRRVRDLLWQQQVRHDQDSSSPRDLDCGGRGDALA